MPHLQISGAIQHIVRFLVALCIQLFRLIPFPLLYLLSGLIFFIMYVVVGYRKKIVLDNLKTAFPEWDRQKIHSVARSFYLNLSDIMVETVKGFTMSESVLKKRFRFLNPEILDPAFNQHQSIIIMGSHYGNWEWGVLSVSLWLKHQVIGVYKPIKNRHLDAYMAKLRRRWGLQLASMGYVSRALIENKNRVCAYVFIADQSPSDVDNAHWLPFFGKDTAFLHGVDKIARRTDFPVFCFYIQRVKRGYYEVIFKELAKTPKALDDGALTALFAQDLENYIKAHPNDWLWSHRRWKRKKESRNNF